MVESHPTPRHPRFQDLSKSPPFGRLTVLRYAGRTRSRISRWECRCECGTIVVVAGTSLTRGGTRSCGCLQRELVGKRSTTHGGGDTREYHIWLSMKSRCLNPKHARYKDYGGKPVRPIRICQQWLDSFTTFLADMGPCPSARHTIDRIDNDGDYCPENCRWATAAEQRRNTRPGHTHRVEYAGLVLCLTDWEKRTGISRKILRRRLDNGWPKELAFTLPPGSTWDKDSPGSLPG